MNEINFTAPLDNHFANEQEGNIELAIKQLVHKQFATHFQGNMEELLNYGTPHLGSGTVVEKFAKKDGLAVLRREKTPDEIMRAIYAEWVGKAGKRGLNFLEFALRMIWGNEFKIDAVYHSIKYADAYPRFLTLQKSDDVFLTSRRYITISKNIDLKEVSELAPTLQQLVPANILPVVLSELANGEASMDFSVACVGLAFDVVTIE